ncbi:MAG: hypothetical protein R3C58_14135 [Parvularculaceae bacterium]
MQLADIKIIDDPYTTFILAAASLNLAPALAGLTAEARAHLARLADGVVESVLNFPADIEGHRFIARAQWRETLTFERDYASWRLGRAPVSIVAATLDGTPIDPAELIVQGASGTIRLAAGCWPAGAALSVDYDGGWLTPAQLAAGAPTDFGPILPQPIVSAAVRAAQLAWSGLAREDIGVRTTREEDSDSGTIETTFAAPPVESGQDADIFRLLAPWRRLELA